MPEGDTVWHTAVKLRDGLVGKTLTRCDVRIPRFATVDLTGHTVDEVLSRGKHLFIRVGPASIHSHLKMDGSWRVMTKNRGVRPSDHRVRIILEASDIQAAGIDLGQLEILARDDDMSVVAHLGPDLLGADWDPARAAANLTADPDRPIAAALLDQRVMAGVGNVYCNELCFVFGVLPTAPVARVADPLRVVSRAHDMMVANRAHGTAPPPEIAATATSCGCTAARATVPPLRHSDRDRLERGTRQLLVPTLPVLASDLGCAAWCSCRARSISFSRLLTVDLSNRTIDLLSAPSKSRSANVRLLGGTSATTAAVPASNARLTSCRKPTFISWPAKAATSAPRPHR